MTSAIINPIIVSSTTLCETPINDETPIVDESFKENDDEPIIRGKSFIGGIITIVVVVIVFVFIFAIVLL